MPPALFFFLKIALAIWGLNGLFYLLDILYNSRSTTKQRPRVDSQRAKKGETEHATMEINQLMNQTEKDRKRNNGNTKHGSRLTLVNPTYQ